MTVRASVCHTTEGKERWRIQRERETGAESGSVYLCMCVCSCVYACPSLPGREREGDCAQNVAVRKSAYPHACVEARAHVRINRFASLQPCVCVHACATPPPPHLASVASSSSIQISGLWRRCRPDSRCTAPASYRGSSAAGEQSVGGRVALLLVASAGSNRWRLPLPWLSRYKNSLVSVLVSSLFSCVHPRGRSADETRHKPPVSALPAITAPYFSHNAVKSKKNKYIYIYKKIINHTDSRYCIFSAVDILLAIDLKRTTVYLSVTFHRSVCQSGNSSCHWTAPPNNLSTPRSSVCAPMVNGRDRQLKKISERHSSASESSCVLSSEKRPFVFRWLKREARVLPARAHPAVCN